MDRRYLRRIAEHHAGGPVGVETLAAALAEARDTLEDVVEPFLIQEGLVLRTSRGRMLGEPGWRHLDMAPPPQGLVGGATRSAAGRWMNGHSASIPPEGRHRYTVRVYYEDTDAGGIVYHATYLRYAERARTEALRDLGVPHAELVRQCNLMFVVRRIEVDYLRAARLDNSLVVETEVLVAGAASATLRQTVRGESGACAVLTVKLACVRLRPVPADVELGELGATERGPEGLRPGGLRPEGLRPEGLRPEGLRPEGLRPGELRPEGLGPEGLRPEGLRPEGLGPDELRPGELAPGEPGPGETSRDGCRHAGGRYCRPCAMHGRWKRLRVPPVVVPG